MEEAPTVKGAKMVKYKNHRTGATLCVQADYSSPAEYATLRQHEGVQTFTFESSAQRKEYVKRNGFKHYNRFTKRWE